MPWVRRESTSTPAPLASRDRSLDLRFRTQTFACTIAVLASSALAQKTSKVRLRVVEVSGRSVYFDKGRDDGIKPGARVRVFLLGTSPRDIQILESSKKSSRADWPPGMLLPIVGTHAEAVAELAPPKKANAVKKQPERDVPDHPPWDTDDREFEQQSPLLIPAFGTSRKARPTEWRGRTFALYQQNEDRGGDRRSRFMFGRIGTDLESSNLLGYGGEMHLIAVVDRRGVDLLDEDDSSDTRARLDRFSYVGGISEKDPMRFELGRFISDSIPEFGLIDGAEAFARMSGGYRLGGGIGALPEPFPIRATGDDFGFHVFAELPPSLESGFAAIVAFQKTWHKGVEDRDQVFGRFEYRPNDHWSFWSSARIDFYDSSDLAKNSGPELTEFWTQGQWTPQSDYGMSLSVSRYRWADIKRNEFVELPPASIRDARVDRTDVSFWTDITDALRFRIRSDYWKDQLRHGSSGELNVDINEFISSSGYLFLSAQYTDAAFSSGPTFRTRYSQRFGDVYTSLSYVASLLEVEGFGGVKEDATRHIIRGECEISSSLHWDTNFSLERSFGDRDDSFSFSVFLQHRF